MVFENGGSNGVIFGWGKSKMAADGHFEKIKSSYLCSGL